MTTSKTEDGALKVSAIYGLEPRRDGDLQTSFILGGKHRGQTITSIVHETHNYGDHGIGWYVIKSGDAVLAEMQERAVGEVYYAQPDAMVAVRSTGGQS